MSTAAPILLTPGPLTTSARTRQAMMVDWGSWDERFNQLTASTCAQLLAILNGAESHHCIPLQGSGTFAVEAAIGTLVPRDGKVLVLINGAYGKRLAKICEVLGRTFSTFATAEDEPTTAADVDRLLHADPAITHVALIHCETSTGILNPLPQIAEVVKRHGKRLIVDAMSSFGALPIDARQVPFEALIAASGKCLEGVPGMGFVFAEKQALAAAQGNCHSLAMDLFEQHSYMAKTGQWRFTPPTHVVAALHEALLHYHEEGGLPARHQRYANNCQALLDGMAELGLRSFLPAAIQAPIIVTFHAPKDPRYQFKAFYERVKAKGFILYPGKLTEVETFRVGCIGHVDIAEMQAAVAAVAQVLQEMEVLDI
ncbi:MULTISPECIES: 2-aminoethylphosphonate--pyruvate transaminase [unclassified Pseudomonas]|uniref:2-aminoethylphosphonate--pyruvate transaminase n=1 Tax=unclassified Pseudomonas TaxID=196821 RepID=UPI000C882E35|nr:MULTISPECIES: 2-aminoethylphosphonate--pyruvate transaminase [unclassified Pseudomonas]PMX21992.1 2-aminoethylphosphonate--pyruvate transaminase [Pseudomonas sp. GW460-12]PMX31587.1 2-aminoethylphosphonate--pyruvate transaminase [Pseudomonas sp. MPR-R2A4]PMX37430.1 2-aminoethylphosphonate--pyruvate transaminase [Pseudomonas sp. MPR-R2A7]PMX51642.1 2-aminoethylphosphonate--pyruvate transaminase [Pseudomonas sp. MPR-R2A6]PMX86902.1 2-aminoethylphosphonate--pyruvate transaminase [Pseudomonas s